MSFARRFVRQWRWWAVVLAALTLLPLYERRPGGPLDRAEIVRLVERVEALADLDPAAAEALSPDALRRVTQDLVPRVRAARVRARIRIVATGGEPSAGFLDAVERDVPDAIRSVFEEARRFAQSTSDDLRRAIAAETAQAPAVIAMTGVPSYMRARALFLAGRYVEATDAAREAGEIALYLEAESLRRLERPDAESVAARLVRSGMPSAGLGHLVLGRMLLARGDAAGWLHVVEALPATRSGWLVALAALDREALYAELRARAFVERTAERLRGPAAAFDRWHRLHPSEAGALSDAAELSVRFGVALAAEGRPEEARPARRLAAAHYLRLASVQPLARAHALRRGAEELLAAGDYLEAAEAFQALPDKDAVYHEGVARGRAGLVRSALERLATYLERAPKGDSLVPDALVARARLLASVGDDQALPELEKFFTWPQLAVGPLSREWREALLLKARLHERARNPDAARATLQNFVELYGPPDSGAPRGEVAFARVQLAVAEMQARRWPEALKLLDEARTELRATADPSEADSIELAGIIAGDAYLGLGKPAEARLSYDVAARAIAAPAWRIVALVGRGRASLRLGMREEAGTDYKRARALYDTNRAAAGPLAFQVIEALRRELP
jgi:tetratricopeptide (TPR) repeat protein